MINDYNHWLSQLMNPMMQNKKGGENDHHFPRLLLSANLLAWCAMLLYTIGFLLSDIFHILSVNQL